MILEVGKAGKCRFVRGIKKTNIFEIGEYGMVVEREKNIISLYATNSRCSEIYCTVTLGNNSILKGKKNIVAAAYARDIMLLDADDTMVVVDYEQKKVAVNKPEISVIGRGEWTRMDWEPYFNAMFGLPVGEAELAAAEAMKNRENAVEMSGELPEPEAPGPNGMEQFWAWFAEHEEEIVDKTLEGGEEAEIITARLRVRLAVVFPYERPENIEFSLSGDGEKNTLAVYHFNRERMKADAGTLGEYLPEDLKERWNYFTEA